MSLATWLETASLESFPGSGGDISQELDTPELTGGNFEQPEHIDHLVDQQQTESDLANTAEAVIAFEAYGEILRNSRGGIDPTTARILAVGIEQHIGYLTDEAINVSIEDFGNLRSREGATNVSLESLGDAVKAGVAKLKELLLKAWEIAKHAYVSIANDIERLRPVAEKIKSRLASAGNAKGGEQISIANPGKLMAGSDFKGQDISPVMGLAVFASKVYPKQAAAYISQLASTIKSTMAAGGDQELINAINAIRTPLSGLHTNSEILPGNVKPGEANAGEFHELKDLRKLIASRCLHLEKVEGNVPDSVQITAGQPRELAARLTQIMQTMDLIGSIKNNAQQMAPAIKTLTDTVEWLEKDRENQKAQNQAEGTGVWVRSANGDLITGLGAVSKMFGVDMTEVLQYCYRTVAAYLAVLAQEVNALEAGNAA